MLLKFLIAPLLMFSFLYGGTDLKPGDVAPGFELKDGHGKTHKLSDYTGKVVALYFYPKDEGPACTTQACNLRDNYTALVDSGIVVLGVSYDDSVSHKAFSEKYDLPFPLLADTDKEVTEAYGAKSFITGLFVSDRITFLIGKDGKIMHVFDDVEIENHAQQILAIVRKENN